MKFKTVILSHGKTATGVEVPVKIVEALGQGKRPAVRVTIQGHTYRSSVAVMGGKFMLGISAENREAAGVKAGDKVEIELEADTEVREVTVPQDLKKALENDPGASEFFNKLSYSNKQRHVLAIGQAKTPETREKRISKMISLFREGRS